MDKLNIDSFKEQIKEDIEYIKKSYSMDNDPLAFDFWILTKLYNLDEELAFNNVTEYNDKSIDCFVHFKELKELSLIQNKYYNENSNLNRKDVTDFLLTPLTVLMGGKYKSSELQEVFNKAKDDDEYKILLNLYVSNNNNNQDAIKLIEKFNTTHYDKNIKCEIRAKIYYLKDIKDLYYGMAFKDDVKFQFKLHSVNQGTVLQIRPEAYKLPGMSESYYLMAPIIDLYNMYKDSLNKDYSLFDENIREYLGNNSINNKIIRTLKDENEKSNFFYYNNGITIICDNVQLNKTPYSLILFQPQIVNGCQTINTIHEVLNDYELNDRQNNFKDVFIIAKVLVKNNDNINQEFYNNVVKYTNSQNAINEKAFASKQEFFLSMQNHFKSRGFLLLVKPSDKNIFSKEYGKHHSEKNELIKKAKEYANIIGLNINSLNDVMIPLDKLLQVFIAFIKDGYFAYTKKNLILNESNDLYQNYSLKTNEYLTEDNLIRLFLLYKKAEIDKKNSEDQKTPIPYYLIGFIGYFISDKNFRNLNNAIQTLFNYSKEDFDKIYEYFKSLTNLYKNGYGKDYNIMIKQNIDYSLLLKQISILNGIESFKKVVDNFKLIIKR